MNQYKFGYRSGYGVYYRVIVANDVKTAWKKMQEAMSNLIDGNIHDYWIEH